MKGLLTYYLSRILLSLAVGALLWITGSTLPMTLLITALLIGLFFYAPHSGRYLVRPELGVFAMQRDEQSGVINDRAGRNAFVATALFTGAISIWAGQFGGEAVPLNLLRLALALGALTYFISDLLLRRA